MELNGAFYLEIIFKFSSFHCDAWLPERAIERHVSQQWIAVVVSAPNHLIWRNSSKSLISCCSSATSPQIHQLTSLPTFPGDATMEGRWLTVDHFLGHASLVFGLERLLWPLYGLCFATSMFRVGKKLKTFCSDSLMFVFVLEILSCLWDGGKQNEKKSATTCRPWIIVVETCPTIWTASLLLLLLLVESWSLSVLLGFRIVPVRGF